MYTVEVVLWKKNRCIKTLLNALFVLAILSSTSDNRSWAQSISLFTATIPTTLATADSNAVTLGVKFWSSRPGTISAISFYRGAPSPHGYVASLYSADGRTLLGSVTIKRELGPVPGWQVAAFATPIPIAANTTYVAAYYSPNGRYASKEYGLTTGITAGSLTAPASPLVGGNGVYNYGRAFPNKTYNNRNYFVDVVFVPTVPAPYLTLALYPPNPTIASSAPPGAHVAAIAAAWSDGSPFTGKLSFAPPYSDDGAIFAISGNNLVINPSGPGVSSGGNTIQHVSIVATQ